MRSLSKPAGVSEYELQSTPVKLKGSDQSLVDEVTLTDL